MTARYKTTLETPQLQHRYDMVQYRYDNLDLSIADIALVIYFVIADKLR